MISLEYFNIKRLVNNSVSLYNKGKIDNQIILQTQTEIFHFCNKYANVLKTNKPLLKKISNMQAKISEIRTNLSYTYLDY